MTVDDILDLHVRRAVAKADRLSTLAQGVGDPEQEFVPRVRLNDVYRLLCDTYTMACAHDPLPYHFTQLSEVHRRMAELPEFVRTEHVLKAEKALSDAEEVRSFLVRSPTSSTAQRVMFPSLLRKRRISRAIDGLAEEAQRMMAVDFEEPRYAFTPSGDVHSLDLAPHLKFMLTAVELGKHIHDTPGRRLEKGLLIALTARFSSEPFTIPPLQRLRDAYDEITHSDSRSAGLIALMKGLTFYHFSHVIPDSELPRNIAPLTTMAQHALHGCLLPRYERYASEALRYLARLEAHIAQDCYGPERIDHLSRCMSYSMRIPLADEIPSDVDVVCTALMDIARTTRSSGVRGTALSDHSFHRQKYDPGSRGRHLHRRQRPSYVLPVKQLV